MDVIETAALSPAQEAILFECLLHDDKRYQVQITMCFETILDPDRLKAALECISEQHEILRTVVNVSDYEVPVQEIRSSSTCEFECHLSRSGGDSVQRTAIGSLDYTKAPVRLLLLLEQSRCKLVITYHHIVMDGWSGSRFVLSLLDCYRRAGNSDDAQPIPSYRAYQSLAEQQDHQAMYRFWQRHLDGCRGTVFGESDISGNGNREEHTIRFLLRPGLVQKMQAFIKTNNCTAACVLSAAWALVLSELLGREDVVFGFVFSGRHLPLQGIEQVLGVLFHCVPIRIKSGQAHSPQWLWGIQNTMLDVMENQFLPLPQIMEAANSTGNPLYSTVLAIENYPLEQVTKTMQELHVTGVDFIEHSSVGLLVQIFMRDQIEIAVTYCSSGAECAALCLETVFQEKVEEICCFYEHSAEGD